MWDVVGTDPRTFRAHEMDTLEEGMATRSSVLAWRIPWTEEPGWLQPMGSQIRAQLSNLARTQPC